MPWILKPERWKEQPTSPVLLDYTHPLVSGGYLAHAVLPFTQTPEGWTQGGSSTLELGQSIGGLCWEGGINKYISSPYTKPSTFVSIQIIWHPPASANGNGLAIFSLASTATSAGPWVLLNCGSGGEMKWYLNGSNMTDYSGFGTGSGKTAIFQLSYNGTNWNAYINGSYHTSKAGYGSNAATNLFINSGYASQATGQIDQVLVWNELCVTQDQFMELAIAPYSIWCRDPEIVYFFPAVTATSVPVFYHQRKQQGIA